MFMLIENEISSPTEVDSYERLETILCRVV